MDSIHSRIVSLLRGQPLKPGELAGKLGISRQALHRHLRTLVQGKQIQKHGAGPHVAYSAIQKDAANARVREDHAFSKVELLPPHLDDYGDQIEKFVRRLQKESPAGANGRKVNLAFLLDSAAVYSSNIEGNTLDLNSFLNSRMAPRKHRPKEAREIEDLVSAYEYAKTHTLDEKNILHAHAILSREFVAASRQGVYRKEPVGVFSRQGLEYMAVEWQLVPGEMDALFDVVQGLLRAKQAPAECFFWGAWLHLIIALIHPFSDGNGRTARLCEKWFLSQTLGRHLFALQSEESYWKKRPQYYQALRLGPHYWEADLRKASPFFALLPERLVEGAREGAHSETS
jgi:Fic family protein